MYLSRYEEYKRIMMILDNLKKCVETMKEDFEHMYKAQDNKYKKLIEYMESEIKINEQSIEELKNPFLLFIVGSGNYGKSTLINSLLKENILETKDLPNTWKVDLFIKSNNEKMEIVEIDNNRKSISIKDGYGLLKEEEEKYKTSKKQISKMVNEHKKSKKIQLTELKNYKKSLEEKCLYKSNICEVRYFLKKPLILDDFIIVDTPGLNQNLVKDTLERMKKYYIRADGVIWIIDAQNIVSKENNEIIKEINEINKLCKEKKNIIAVVNKMDVIDNEGSDNIYKVKSKTKEIYEKYFNDIVFISAKQAITGMINNDYDLIKKSNIEDLNKSIEVNFKQISEEAQIKSKYNNLLIMKNNITKEIYKYKRDLYNDISRYNEAEYQLKEKTKTLDDYIKKYLQDIKSKNYVEEDIELKSLKEDLKSIENVCNDNLNKMYSNLCIISTFGINKSIENRSFNLQLCKSKHIIMDYRLKGYTTDYSKNIKDKFFNKLVLTNTNNKPSDKTYIKNYISDKIENLNNEILEKIEDTLSFINTNINKLRKESFEDVYVDYSNINSHIKQLDNIENILNKLG